MPRKTKRQKQRTVTRHPGAATAPPTAAAPTGVAVEAEDLQPLGPGPGLAAPPAAPDVPVRRRVERLGSTPAAAGQRAPTAAGRPGRPVPGGYIQPLDTDDAAIPFDRVPYVPSDLRRVGVIAVLMVVLIIVADIIVSNLVR